MRAKEFVKMHHPTAKAESHKPNGFAPRYWLIREYGHFMYMADGTSESNAWVNAKKVVLKRLEKEKQQNLKQDIN